MSESLKKCSRCKSTIQLQYFSKNRKGEYFKCCNNCKHNKKNIKLSADKITPCIQFIDKARADYIYAMITNSDDTLIYLGQVDPTDFNFQQADFMQPTGNEKVIEYHAFKNMDTGQTMICRWRLKLDDNITSPVHIMYTKKY